MNKLNWGLCGLLGLSLAACSAPSSGSSESGATAVRLELTTTGSSGAKYRLGPASFVIEDQSVSPPATQTVSTGDEAGDLIVPLAASVYTVTLQPGWQLQKVNADGSSTPVAATLTSEASQFASVIPFRETPIHYAFHLGESGIDIGISVDDGAPASN